MIDFFWFLICRHRITQPYLGSLSCLAWFWCSVTPCWFLCSFQECTSSPLIAPRWFTSVQFIVQKTSLMFWWTMVDTSHKKSTRGYQRWKGRSVANWIPMIGQDLARRLCGERGQPWPKILPEDASAQQTWVPWLIMFFLIFWEQGCCCGVFQGSNL